MTQTKLASFQQQEAAAWRRYEVAYAAAGRAWRAYYALSKRRAAMEERENIAQVRALPELHRHAYVRHMERLVAAMPADETRAKIADEVARVKRAVLAP